VEGRWKIRNPLPPRKHQYIKAFPKKDGRWKRNATKFLKQYIRRDGSFVI
jgi:hypothetical protein